MKRLTDEEILQEYKLRKAELEGKLRIINDNISLFTGSPIEEKNQSADDAKKMTWKQWFDYCLTIKDCTIADMIPLIKPYKTDLSDKSIKDCLVQAAYNLGKEFPDKYTYTNIAAKGKLYKYSLKK